MNINQMYDPLVYVNNDLLVIFICKVHIVS